MLVIITDQRHLTAARVLHCYSAAALRTCSGCTVRVEIADLYHTFIAVIGLQCIRTSLAILDQLICLTHHVGPCFCVFSDQFSSAVTTGDYCRLAVLVQIILFLDLPAICISDKVGRIALVIIHRPVICVEVLRTRQPPFLIVCRRHPGIKRIRTHSTQIIRGQILLGKQIAQIIIRIECSRVTHGCHGQLPMNVVISDLRGIAKIIIYCCHARIAALIQAESPRPVIITDSSLTAGQIILITHLRVFAGIKC